MHVLDASAFIHQYRTDEPVASIPDVREELVEEHAYRFEAREGAGMHLHVPEGGSVSRIERAARGTGDLDELSETDVRLLAAALELDGVLVTDDYALQNVAGELGVPTRTVGRDGIEEQRTWQFQCAGCGRTFEENHDRCPVCGSGLARTSS